MALRPQFAYPLSFCRIEFSKTLALLKDLQRGFETLTFQFGNPNTLVVITVILMTVDMLLIATFCARRLPDIAEAIMSGVSKPVDNGPALDRP
jgi:hypothetical protein